MFLAVVSLTMREALINYIKAKKARKRGGDIVFVTFEEQGYDPEEALALQGADFMLAGAASDDGLSSRLDSPADSRPTPELRRKSLEEVALQMRKKADEDVSQQPNAGGFGRWVKKHWYVPVIAAVAIGFVVADSDDTDATGEED